MKKLLLIALAAMMCLGALVSCGSGAKDWAYIEEKGNMVIGITLYEPMNYYDDNGKLIGFDTEFAEAICAKLGVTPEFQVIEWEQKENELKSKTIDVIWNGLTVTEERKENMAFSTAYVSNKQVVVIKAANAEKFATLEGMAGASCVAENGSAGETAIQTNDILSKNAYVAASAQKDALLEVKAGTSDLAVIDLVMAQASIKEGTDYADLMIVEGIELTAEEYAIGLRLEDTEFLAKINAAIDEMVADGSLAALAEKYGLTDVFAFK
ncbi:MAG: transporter substrate-binding domain-containing protein [Firmicutes bacterium]|nr:transporter substrate-binding domain-containing protein [Bacillota bacterium]